MLSEKEELPILRVNVIEKGGAARANWLNCELENHLDFSTESLSSYFFAKWHPIVFDALLVAAAVEFCDRVKLRPKRGWGRAIELRLPVHDVDCWRRIEVQSALREALEFLTGDQWEIRFVTRRRALSAPPQGIIELQASNFAVLPFSEGLDSRAVAGLMAAELGDGLIRVRLGNKTNDRPKTSSGRGQPFTAVPYSVHMREYSFPEASVRSRGFKFATLSSLAAYLSKAHRIIVPESGQGALGPSLVPVGQSYVDYRNHPLFTQRMEAYIKALLGQAARFEFPRIWTTKGETLKAYVDSVASANWSETRSCWQDTRHVSVDGQRRQCGICAACMLRRMSIHAAGLSELPDTYVWDNLKTNTFEQGAAAGLKKIEKVQREYAIAGALHLDHLASLKDSRIHAAGLHFNAKQIARALAIPNSEAEAKLDRLLNEHGREWNAYARYLGPNSFMNNWTGRKQ